MRVISRKTLIVFGKTYPASIKPLDRWYRVVHKANWVNFADVRGDFPSADSVGDLIVFNIAGNKFRLIAAVHFNRQIAFIRAVLTHKEYDEGTWKE
jgi:mRNA interferase HigB